MPTAVGDVFPVANSKKAICLMAAATANVAAPASATAGVAMYPQYKTDGVLVNGHAYGGRPPLHSTLMIKGRCDAAEVLVGTFTLWGYLAAAEAWFEIPVNGGTALVPTALAETSADQINFQQQFTNLGHYDRIALELASIGGAGATFDAFLVTSMLGGH